MSCIFIDELFPGQAEIGKARGLLAVMDSAPENLFVTLSARQMNPDLTIVARGPSANVEQKLLRAGADRVVLPLKIGAHHLAQAALRPGVVDFIEIATRTSTLDIDIEEMEISASSSLAGKKLCEAKILRELAVIVIGIRQPDGEQMSFNPPEETLIGANDTLITMGKAESLEKLRELTK